MDKQARENIAGKVKGLRKSRGWTQAELSKHLGLSQARLSEIENGQGSFTAEQFLTILKLFNVGVSHFSTAKHDSMGELDKVLARLGALHLQENPELLPSDQLETVNSAIQEALVVSSPRTLAALAPVFVLHIDQVNLGSLRVALTRLGLEQRLGWVVENIASAIADELLTPLSASWSRRYRRALLLLETALETSLCPQSNQSPDSENRSRDVLDGHIRSKPTMEKAWKSASSISRRWGIVSSLQPQDFAIALRGARESH